MKKYKAVTGILLLASVLTAAPMRSIGDELEDNWGNYLHYTKIGRLDLAKGYAQAVLDAEPDPVVILGYVQDNPQAVELLRRAAENEYDPQLAELTNRILGIIEQGKFALRTEPATIAEEVRRLNSTARGRVTAVKRLENAGEYAIPFMIDAMADPSRRDELPNIIWALPQIGRDAIRPLVVALQTDNTAIRVEIVKALGEIGYPHSLGYLKYVVENDSSDEIRDAAQKSVEQIDPAQLAVPAAELLYRLAEDYYYHVDSLAPAEDANFCNIWFWDRQGRRLIRQEVDRAYFYELMSMRSCEWALRADAGFGRAIGLWLASFFKAESTGLAMPEYFGQGHADALVYATTAGPEYLHQALARAIKDKNSYVALHTIEALEKNAGEKSLMYRLEMEQPLLEALSYDDKAVRYSAAIAIAGAGPKEPFAESRIVVQNLADALSEDAETTAAEGQWNKELAEGYALRAVNAMLKLAVERNTIINLAGAEPALIDATKGDNTQIKLLAAQVLAYLYSPAAQRAIAAMALNDENPLDIRIAAFESLASSAKINGNLLGDEEIDAIYDIVGSQDSEPTLRSAAAVAYGSLNLPSQKVKDLILDQAKS
jgi:HEAT repeat protein